MSKRACYSQCLRVSVCVCRQTLDLFTVRHLAVLLTFVSIAVTPAYPQATPVASGAAFVIDEDPSGPLSGTLTASDADNDPLTFQLATPPRHGRVEISPGGAFSYMPDPNFNGYDKFGYVAKDPARTSTEATVLVRVNPVNDAPVAGSMEFRLPENGRLIGQLQGKDVDGDTLTYTQASSPQNGTLAVEPDGRFEYLGTSGNDSFAYVVSDGRATSTPATVTITLAADSVGFIGDTLLPNVTSAEFPPGPDSSMFPQVVLPDAVSALDMAVDRANHRLYVLTRQALKIYHINIGAHPATLLFWQSVGIREKEGMRLCLSLDGRTAYIGGTGKVTAMNLYPEAIFTKKKLLGLIPAQSKTKEAFEIRREFSFPEDLKDRSVAAMGVHPAGDRLFVVIDMNASDKKLGVSNDLILGDSGAANKVLWPEDFGYITALHIAADVETSTSNGGKRELAPPINIRSLVYKNRGHVAIGPRSLTFSPDGNCAFIAAVGAQTPRATPFGVMPTSDDGTGGIVVLDVRPPATPSDACAKYLGFIPTTEKGEKTAELRRQILQEGKKIVHPEVQWARNKYLEALGQIDLGGSNQFEALQSLSQFTVAAGVLASMEESFKHYGNMQAYANLYPHDMVGASSVAINHRGDFGVVTLQDTNNLGLLALAPSTEPAGYRTADEPPFYIEVGTAKAINGFDAQLGNTAGQPGYDSQLQPYAWAYPQQAVFTSDDSRLYIGMAGGTPKADSTNKFGSADGFTLRAARDRRDTDSPAAGYQLLGNVALKSPRLAVTLPGLASDHDQLSDQLKAYNRWNSLRVIANDPQGERKARLVSTDVDHLTIPGKPTAYTPGTLDALKFGFLLPTSGLGYRRNTFGQPADATSFASRAVVTALEQLGQKWDNAYHQYLRSHAVDPDLPITRPYFLVGLLSQPGGGVSRGPDGAPLKYSPNTGFEADFPYFKVDSDAAHDFVTTNGPASPTNNRGETKKGFDLPNTVALVRLLLADPHVKKIELDPYIVDLVPELKGEPRVIPHGSRVIKNSRRDLDDRMFVTFAQLNVDLSIDSDNDGVLDRTPEEDTLEDRAGGGAKFVLPNFGDLNGNQIPDYADGYDLYGGPDAANASARFTPMVIRFPDELNLPTTQFVLRYSGSDPAQVTRSGAGPYEYTLPTTGAYRIWAKDGNQARQMAQINAGGDYIAADVTYWVTDLLARAGSAGTNRSVTVYLESVRPDSQPDQNRVIVEIFPENSVKTIFHDVAGVSALSDTVIVASGVVSIAVDANRDGQIKFASEDSSDATSAAAPYRFWLNDDDDERVMRTWTTGNAYTESELDDREVTSDAGNDCNNVVIDTERDLEDLARLWIYTQGLNTAFKNGDMQLGLKWTDVTNGAPAIRLFRAVETNGGNAYLFDEETAHSQVAQIGQGYGLALGSGVVEGTTTFILPGVAFSNLSEDQPMAHLLFEGVKAGKGQLKLVILDKNGAEIGEGPGVWMELKEPHEFVERYTCGDQSIGAVQPLAHYTPSTAFGAPTTEDEKDYVLYVHGYNMEDPEKQRWIETVFKRLYWLGYKGRVGGFSWPCAYGLIDQIRFDESEERAWQAGVRLMEHLQNLKNAGYRIHVIAHSQGNVVMSEALRLWQTAGNTTALVNTYIASQAAVAAHCYNAAAPLMPNYDQDTPNVYAVYWKSGDSPRYPQTWPASNPPYFDTSVTQSAAGRRVNFYNPQDYALTAANGGIGSWETDQRLKPNQGFGYSAAYGFERGGGALIQLSFPDDRYVIFSYCAEARSVAMGANATGGIFGDNTRNLQEFGYAGEHLWHSAQFRSFNAARYRYWQALMGACDLTPYNPNQP